MRIARRSKLRGYQCFVYLISVVAWSMIACGSTMPRDFALLRLTIGSEALAGAPQPVHTFLNINQLAWPGMLVEVDVIAITKEP